MILLYSECHTGAKTTDMSSLLKEVYQVHLCVVNGMSCTLNINLKYSLSQISLS